MNSTPTTNIEAGRCLTPGEAANWLGVSLNSLYRRAWRAEHGLPAVRIGRALRFRVCDLDHWLTSRRERTVNALEAREV
jgi:excisionase family DNA binding protein